VSVDVGDELADELLAELEAPVLLVPGVRFDEESHAVGGGIAD